MAKILVAEDEADIRELLLFNLEREGFDAVGAPDGLRAVELALERQPDLLLLDIMLPGLDGLEVCKRLQRDPKTSNIPIIMLTAKGEEVDRIVGFELGASDYVVKPFSLREVLLRIKAVLRRGETRPGPTLCCGAIRLEPESHAVTVDGAPVELTATEFRLLEDLLLHAGKVRNREQLLDAVWGYSFDGYARTVDTHVRRLRSKLGAWADGIETVRGVGYRAKGSA